MKIGTREVGPGAPTFIIAEAGVNYRGRDDLDGALGMIDLAAGAGADAVKFQYFRVDRFIVPRSYAEDIRYLEMPDEWLPLLKSRCTERGVEFMCTAFDLESLAVIDPFVNAHKIGSWEAENVGYCIDVMNRQKPMLISHGRLPFQMAYGREPISLRCVSEYPAKIAGYLSGPKWIGFWGVSDHTMHPTIVPAAAVALGACMVEKHFVDERGKGSIDDRVSLNPAEFATMVEAVRLTESAVRG